MLFTLTKNTSQGSFWNILHCVSVLFHGKFLGHLLCIKLVHLYAQCVFVCCCTKSKSLMEPFERGKNLCWLVVSEGKVYVYWLPQAWAECCGSKNKLLIVWPSRKQPGIIESNRPAPSDLLSSPQSYFLGFQSSSIVLPSRDQVFES